MRHRTWLRSLAVIVILPLLLSGAPAPALVQASGPRADHALPQGEPDSPPVCNGPLLCPGVFFLHVATSGNTTFSYTTVDHPLLNGLPGAIFFVTQNWNPNGGGAVHNPSSIGVWYDSSNSRWTIFTQSEAAMPVGAAFNIYIPPQDDTAFIHTSSAGNTTANTTTIDNALTNSNPDAKLIVTQRLGVYNNHEVGVTFDTGIQKWKICNPDPAATMWLGAQFNVLVASADETVFVHTSTAGNTSSAYTLFNHPGLNGNPDAFAILTPRLGTTEYNNHPVGAYFRPGARQWGVLNEDEAGMPLNTAFNVLVAPWRWSAFVTEVGVSWYVQALDHPLLNHNPYAIVFVTQRLNVPSGGYVYNPAELGVWYDGLGWYVYNLNGSVIPTHASFNVYVAAPGQNVWTHFASTANIDPTYPYRSYLYHRRLDGNSSALALFTHVENPMGLSGIGDPNGKGLGYYGRWFIFHYNSASWTPGAAMNVMLPPDGAKSFFHIATVGNTVGGATIVDNPWINDNPTAMLFVTKNGNANGIPCADNLHPVGVWYNAITGHWSIFDEDGADMVVGSGYSVMVVDIHKTRLPLVLK